jgi:hypothetical protein
LGRRGLSAALGVKARRQRHRTGTTLPWQSAAGDPTHATLTAMPLAVSIPELLGYDAIKLGEMVMAGSRQFTIPLNQRPWAWNAQELGQLWTDLLETTDKYFEAQPPSSQRVARQTPIGHPHFFGAFVFDEEAGTFTVVDGQQRLTAVSMLVAALRERATALKPSLPAGSAATSCQSLIDGLSLWLEAGAASGMYLPRLILDPSFADFFEVYVVQPRTDADRQAALEQMHLDMSVLPVQRKLKAGFDSMRDLVLAAAPQLAPEAELTFLRALNSTLAEAFLCLTLRVKNEAFSFSVFGCLNARGTPLTDADKIKNELFDRSPLTDHATVKADWDETVQRCPRRDMPTFLRLRHVAFIGPCPKSHLYRNVVSKEILAAGQTPLSVLQRWKEDAGFLQAIDLASGFQWQPATREILESVQTLGISYSWPALIAAARRFLPANQTNFRRTARIIRNFAFRVLTIEGRDVGVLEEHLGKFARDLAAGGDVATLATALQASDPDIDFEQAFATAAERRVKVQYYILFELERHLNGASGLQPAPHSPRQHIEHILPQTPSRSASRLTEWAAFRDASDPLKTTDLHRLLVNRLGNLLILEADINTSVSNYEFAAKKSGLYPAGAGTQRKSYADSQLALAGQIVSGPGTSWDEAAIAQRQSDLAALALQVWDLSY